MESIRRYTAFNWRASTLATVVLPVAGNPAKMMSIVIARTANSGLSSLAGFPGCHFLIELRRPVAWNAQGLPMVAGKVFGNEHDLADVVGVVRELPIDGLHHGVRLAANG